MPYRKNRLAYLLEGWRPPAGVRSSRPRDVTYSGGGWVVVGCLWICILGGAAAVMGLGEKARREAAEARLLRVQGVETTGIVTRLWRGRGDSKPPYVAFAFEAGGQKYEGRARVRLSEWRRLQLGGDYRIRYVPSNPRLHHPVHIPPSPTPAFAPYLIGGVCFLVGLLLFGLLRRERYLLAEGRVAPGILTEVKDSHGEKYSCVYEFPLLSGGTEKGKTLPSKQARQVGDRVSVIYLPDEPRRNALLPLSLVKPAAVAEPEKRPARKRSTPSGEEGGLAARCSIRRQGLARWANPLS